MLKSAFVLTDVYTASSRPFQADLTSHFQSNILTDLAGQPALTRLLQQLEDSGVREVVIGLHQMGDQIEQTIDLAQMSGCFPNLNVFYSYCEHSLGSGGMVKKALDMLEDPFFIVRADAVWSERELPVLTQMADAYDTTDMAALIGVLPEENIRRLNVTTDFTLGTDGRLVRPPKEHLPGCVDMGIAVTHKDIIAQVKTDVFELTELWQELSDTRHLYGHVYQGAWSRLDLRSGLALARAIATPHSSANAFHA